MSVSLLQLWLPILLSGLLCWICSSLIHMLIKYHNADYGQLPNEKEIAEAMSRSKLKPGLYHMPYCEGMKELEDEEMKAKFINGPISMVTIFENGLPPMGRLLSQQVIFFLVGSMLVATVACMTLSSSAEFITVFKLSTLVAFLAFGYGVIPYSIWYGHPWPNCLRFLLDALIYASVLGIVFAWLWPRVS